MRTPEERLKLNMAKRATGYRKLIALAVEQQEILVSGRHDELTDNVSRQEPLLVELSALDRDMQAQADPVDMDLETRRYAEQTIESALELRDLVRSNSRLLKNAADYTNFSIRIISRMGCEQAAYDERATSDSNPAHALILDLKV